MQSPPRLKPPEDVADLIRNLHPHIKRKIRSALEAIQRDPMSGKQLRAELAAYRSFRVGRIRIIYREKAGIIEVIAVGPRHTIYWETAVILRQPPRDE